MPPLSLPVLGALAAWRDIAHDALILGIGANRRRSELYAELNAGGARFATLRHPTALVGHDVTVGPGSYIGAYVILAAGTAVGANAIVHGNSVIGHHNIIGDHVHIAPGVHTAGHVIVESGVMVGIGANIIPQRCIGAWATVGAGADAPRRGAWRHHRWRACPPIAALRDELREAMGATLPLDLTVHLSRT